MILQEKNYIAKQRKKYLMHSIVWTSVVLVLFIVGLILTKTRANLFTVSACLFAIVASLFITRLISFSHFKDVSEENAQILESVEGKCAIFHSAIVPLAKETAYFDHIVVIENRIYFIASTRAQVEKYREAIKEGLALKGIASKYLSFIVAQDSKQLKEHTNRMCKEIKAHQAANKSSDENTSDSEDWVKSTAQVISEILM